MTFLNNIEIERRVRNPDLFNRNGKFDAFDLKTIHPSLNEYTNEDFVSMT